MRARRVDQRKRREITFKKFNFARYARVFKGRLQEDRQRPIEVKGVAASEDKMNATYQKAFFIDKWIPNFKESYIGRIEFEGKTLYFYEDRRKQRGTESDRKK
ncbi:MAG: hypothetical protein HYW50_03180 [Candidatus Diapherotrites archaeon]|nr:hypothetical protein [Candidatus Diapherotrites archaeon]